mmetsp:Transcript_42558/g.86975  ORF Transcript_42558/g.86975 Transcript_42558/m.86975 type:complete len:207 (-) Transcript_42558:264-884(-)
MHGAKIAVVQRRVTSSRVPTISGVLLASVPCRAPIEIFALVWNITARRESWFTVLLDVGRCVAVRRKTLRKIRLIIDIQSRVGVGEISPINFTSVAVVQVSGSPSIARMRARIHHFKVHRIILVKRRLDGRCGHVVVQVLSWVVAAAIVRNLGCDCEVVEMKPVTSIVNLQLPVEGRVVRIPTLWQGCEKHDVHTKSPDKICLPSG